MIRRILSLLVARNKEFYRDKWTLIWNFAFPLFIILAFGFAFNQQSKLQYNVGVLANQQRSLIPTHFNKLGFVQWLTYDSQNAGLKALNHHKIHAFILPQKDQVHYWINSTSPGGAIVESLLVNNPSSQYLKHTVSGKEIRYIDWLLPGIIGMNLMFSALFGIGYAIVRYRKTGLLKRLSVTPLSPLEFLVAQLISRLAIFFTTALVIYIGCDIIFDFQCLGSYALLATIFFIGGISMMALTLLLTSRMTSEEFASGILNLMSWPMMFLSEIWFSLDKAHPIVRALSNLLPLTHIIRAARAVMNDGANLMAVSTELSILVVITIVCLAWGAKRFRWLITD